MPNIRLIYRQKLMLMSSSYKYHGCLLYGDQDFSFQLYIWRMSTLCQPSSAVCQPHVCCRPAVYQPYTSSLSAVFQLYIGRISAVFQPGNSDMSAACQLYSHHMFTIPISQYAKYAYIMSVKVFSTCLCDNGHFMYGNKRLCTKVAVFLILKYLMRFSLIFCDT